MIILFVELILSEPIKSVVKSTIIDKHVSLYNFHIKIIQNDENDFDIWWLKRPDLHSWHILTMRESTFISFFIYLLMPNITLINIQLCIPRATNMKN